MAYKILSPLNLYDSPACDRLATQAAPGRQLRILPTVSDPAASEIIQDHPSSGGAATPTAIAVQLSEDDYSGWLHRDDWSRLEPTTLTYEAPLLSLAAIQARLPGAIAVAEAAMTQPNVYLWGGTLGPNYDCSGLIQAAFAAVGIWLPRDAYQQEAFVSQILASDLQPGDLVFFGTPVKATHVGLYLGGGCYIHSSGQEQGHNGIGIDQLSPTSDGVSQVYYQQLRGYGRVIASYQPQTPASWS
ncbi:C40 family peptidase [Neosynechococcus sphagnicola]|nr:C40 family peptidase [Neosynechococcus sphagnicola]